MVFTGSTEAGRAVLQAAASACTPVIAELSGDDPVVVRADADAEMAGKALRFATELNGGDSCIAPRRLLAAHGLHLESAGFPRTTFTTDDEACAAAEASAYALGATIFSGNERAALALARRLPAGLVVINDCIVPSADPRIPFGGSKASGFGVTRGAEGLLALTRPKTICLQRGRRFHLEPACAGDADLFAAYLHATHDAGWRERLHWGWRLLRLAAARSKAS